jgi:hypothetical protein
MMLDVLLQAATDDPIGRLILADFLEETGSVDDDQLLRGFWFAGPPSLAQCLYMRWDGGGNYGGHGGHGGYGDHGGHGGYGGYGGHGGHGGYGDYGGDGSYGGSGDFRSYCAESGNQY